VVCGALCGCVRTGMAWSSVFMSWSFATAVSFVAGGCSLRNACMVGAWCVSCATWLFWVCEWVCESLCVGATRLLVEVVCTAPPVHPRNNVLQHGNVLQHEVSEGATEVKVWNTRLASLHPRSEPI